MPTVPWDMGTLKTRPKALEVLAALSMQGMQGIESRSFSSLSNSRIPDTTHRVSILGGFRILGGFPIWFVSTGYTRGLESIGSGPRGSHVLVAEFVTARVRELFICMYVCICVCLYACMHIYIYMYIYIYIHVRVCVCVCVCTYIHVCV
jgi:hypothetical protein